MNIKKMSNIDGAYKMSDKFIHDIRQTELYKKKLENI